ncbi:MAG: molybdopterin-synthase adenylyltransferase MoeB [Rhodothermaceae bacterium]
MLTNSELKRYNRHIIMSEVGVEGQEKLKSARVLVIGAGGLGCPVLQYLSAAGVGTIGIVDYDVVSESNLQRQILFTPDDIDKSKAETASKKLKQQNPNVNFEVFPVPLTKDNVLELFKKFDIIVDGSDNFPTRFLINDACVLTDKPLVSGAIYKFFGQVSVYNYQNGPTYRCIFPEQPEESDLPNCSTIGVIGVIPGLIGSLQANEVIKIIIGKGKTLSGTLLQIDALTMKIDEIEFERDPEAADIKELGEYGETCSIDVADEQVNSISPIDLHEKLKNNADIKIFDVRSKEQFNGYNIGGENVETEDLLFEKIKLPSDKMIVIVCEFGEQSAAIVEHLQHNENLQNVYNLDGGLQKWIDENLEMNFSKNKS